MLCHCGVVLGICSHRAWQVYVVLLARTSWALVPFKNPNPCSHYYSSVPLINVSSKHGGREHVVTAGRLCNSGFCCLAPSKRRPPQHSPSPTYLLLHSNPISCCTGHTVSIQHTCSIYVQLSNNWYPVLLRCYMYFHKTMSAPMHCNATKCSIISEPDFGLLFSSFFWGRVNESVDKGVFGFLKFWWQSHRKHLCWTLVFDNSLLFNVHDGWHWWLKWSKTGQLGPFSNVNQLVAGNIFHILIAVVGCLSPGWAEQILRKSKSITQCPNHQRTHTPSVVFNPRKLNQITSVVLLQEQEWIKLSKE